MSRLIASRLVNLPEVTRQLRFALWRPWLRICPLPSMTEYWDTLNAYDWVRSKQFIDEDSSPSASWNKRNRPLMFKAELFAYRSPVHEEMLAAFVCAVAVGAKPPARP